MRIASGIDSEDVTLGAGLAVEHGQFVTIRWRGTLNRGEEFGTGTSSFRIGRREVIAGLERGVVGMRVGGVRKLRIGSHLAYRDQSVPGVPANAVLNFEVELLEIAE